MASPSTRHLYERYYFSKPGYIGATKPFRENCLSSIKPGGEILEIGAGETNDTSEFLSSIGPLTGLDVDPLVKENRSLKRACTFDGTQFPFEDGSFDACVSNWVLEHVADPQTHFKEVCRVLRPGGVYCFRTPNLFHYVTMGSRCLPHSYHLKFANKLRARADSLHPPYPTFYRANTKGSIVRLLQNTEFGEWRFRSLEPEPSYGRAHPALFYPMMAYERIVNSTRVLTNLRIILMGTARKSDHAGNGTVAQRP